MRIISFLFTVPFLLSFISCASLENSEVRSGLLSARLSIECNKDDEAVKTLSRVLTLAPDNEEALRLRGECFFRTRQFDKALSDLKKLVAAFKSSKYLFLKAKTEYELNLYSDAINDGLAAEKLSSNEYEKFTIWNLLANTYSETSQYAEACKYYNLMIQKQKHPVIYLERASNFVYMREYQKAKDDLTEVAVLTSELTEVDKKNILDDEYYYLVGYCELALGNFKNALAAFNRIDDKQQFDKIEEYIRACQR